MKIVGMRHFGKTLRELRTFRGLSQKALADIVGVTDQRISDYEAMPKPKMYGKTYIAIAHALGIAKQQLDAEWAKDEPAFSPSNPTQKAPMPDIHILATSPAGSMSKPHELGKTMGTVPRSLYPDDPSAFAILVNGDSMSPWVNDGDIVVAVYRTTFPNGTACVVRETTHSHASVSGKKTENAGEYSDTIKYVFEIGGGKVRLEPRNRDAHNNYEKSTEGLTCFPIVLRIFRDYLRLNLKPSGQNFVNQQWHPLGEGPQPSPDYEKLDERHPE